MNLTEKIFALILCAILIGEVLLASYTVSVDNAPLVVIDEYTSTEIGENFEFSVTYSVNQIIYPLVLKVVLIPVYNDTIDKRIYVYYDEDYPCSGCTRAAWIGFIDHIVPTLKLKGYAESVEVVNADRLKEVMLRDFDSIVIIPSGVFPETVHSKNETIVGTYMRNGGTIIWMGDGFAYFSGKFRKNVVWPSEENPGWAGQETILGYPLCGSYSPKRAFDLSPISDALNLQYPGINKGVTISQAIRNGGLILGKVYEDKTSIAAVPVGKGFLIVFGGEIGATRTDIGEDILADDVANILLSNILQSNGQVSVNIIYRENIESDTITINIAKNEFSGISFIVHSVDDYSYFFQRTFLPIN